MFYFRANPCKISIFGRFINGTLAEVNKLNNQKCKKLLREGEHI